MMFLIGLTGGGDRPAVAITPVSGVAAHPLKYLFKDNETPIYEVTIRVEKPDAVETETGHISYRIKSVDPANGQIDFDYTRQLQTNRESKQSRSTGGMPPPMMMPPPPAIPMPPNPFAAQPAPTDILIDSTGKVLRSNRSTNAQQLSAALGLDWELLLPVLSSGGQPNWETSDKVAMTTRQAQQSNHWPPAPPWQQQAPQESVERSAQLTVDYTIDSVSGDMVTIHRKLELMTDEKVGDAPLEKLSGEGQIVFDAKAGLVQSLEYKQTSELNQQNLTVRVPVTVSARLLGPDELAKMKADEAAAQAKFREQQSRQQLADEQAARKLMPTTQQATLQIQSIEATWHSTGKAVDVLPTMEGHCQRDPDGTVTLQRGEKLRTAEPVEAPASIRMVILTQDHDVRLSYAADQIIFNWEMNASDLRVDGGPLNGKHQLGAGKLMPNRWIGIEWIVHPDEMILYVNGIERYRGKADFSQINKPFSIEAHNGALWVKSIQVVR